MSVPNLEGHFTDSILYSIDNVVVLAIPRPNDISGNIPIVFQNKDLPSSACFYTCSNIDCITVQLAKKNHTKEKLIRVTFLSLFSRAL